jgi:hypothetical protein
MKYVRCTIFVATFLASFASPAVHAEERASCQELIKDCFASATDQRDTCLQTVATDPSCTSSDSGALVTKRSQFSSMKQLPQEQGPAFLGPQIINRRCVTNFDTAWSAALVKGSLSKETLASLTAALDECAAPETQAIPHP